MVASDPPAESKHIDDLGKFLSDYDAKRVFFTYYECGICSAYFCPTYFSQKQLGELYAHQPENMQLAPLAARVQTQKSYVSILEARAKLEGRYLEIGADIGLFSELCAKNGNFEDFILYEPNLTIYDELAQRMSGHVVDIRTEDLPDTHIENESVSIAVMIHVLDHLLDPERMLKQVVESLKPGGTLFVITHNRASFLARVLGKRWPPYTMQHPHLFTPQAMRVLLERAGLEDVQFQGTRNSFPATYFVQAGLETIGISNKLVFTMDRPVFGIPLGNIATIAKKPL